ncbi:MAG: hypothetical protein ACREOS_13965, partial [Candidatus Dormibacteraceae bacterium]
MGHPIERTVFDGQVHEALSHLYDLPFLRRSPLVDWLGLRTRDGSGGTALHRALVDAVERLKPPREVSPDAMAWKTYRSLVLRYVRSLNAGAAASELGLSTRQAQRIHLIALESISTLLWDNSRESAEGAQAPAQLTAAGPTDPPDDPALDEELQAILTGGHGELEPFPAILRSALATVEPVFRQRSVIAELSVDVALTHGIAPRNLVRQALVQILLDVVDRIGRDRVTILAEPHPEGALTRVYPEPDSRSLPAAGGLSLPERRLTVARRLLGAIGGRLAVELLPSPRVEAIVPLGAAPTVLTVEDNPQVVHLFRRYLNGSIYRLIHVPDVDVAIEVASEEQPSAITLDVM